MSETKLREHISYFGKSIFDRGLTGGSSGNISVRIDDGFLVTPTNCCFGAIDPARISKLDPNGKHIGGDPPTKEQPMHFAVFEQRRDANAVVHLHSTYCVALSCMKHENVNHIIPPITPYFIMKLGKLAWVPYYPPGDPLLAEAVGKVAANHKAILLANHGPVVSGASLESAVYSMEEFEETAKLVYLLKSHEAQELNQEQVDELKQRYK